MDNYDCPIINFFIKIVVLSIGIDVDFLTQKFTFQKELHGFTHIYMASKNKSFTFKQFYTNLNEFTQFYTYMSIVKHSHLH
jgi:hypothetical protein